MQIPQDTTDSPVWVRVEKAVALYGLSRTKLYQLQNAGKVTSVSLREEGQKKATRLFEVRSIEKYIESFIPKSRVDGGTAV
jgi:glycine cleavage system H lipoate-binding protein